jgi:hypothetical protein
MRELGRALLVGLVVAGLGGCKSSRSNTLAAADAAVQDGGSEARAAVVASAIDAGPPNDTMPDSSSDDLSARSRHLLEAIGKDSSDLAADILFPRDGWLATREASDPGKEWDRRVAGPFRKTVHALARSHPDIEHAQFVSFELGPAPEQVSTRRHGWKEHLWTVHGSRITYLVDGHTRTLAIHEMTAWRGAWYVTRLR